MFTCSLWKLTITPNKTFTLTNPSSVMGAKQHTADHKNCYINYTSLYSHWYVDDFTSYP